ncbi:MAG: hypothetical protein R6V04_08255 [bacterium]
MKPRIYTDTSVIGGCLDIEFEKYSLELLEEFKTDLKIITISDLTLKEIEDAPPEIKEILDNISEINIEYVELDDEARFLANK